jgi:hypothetical protein
LWLTTFVLFVGFVAESLRGRGRESVYRDARDDQAAAGMMNAQWLFCG